MNATRPAQPADNAHRSRRADERRAPALGVAASLIVHAFLLVSLAFILLDRPAGSGGSGDAIELAIVTQAELSAMDAASGAAPAIDAEAPAELLDATIFDTPVAEAALESASGAIAGLEGAGKTIGQGVDLGGGAGGGSASFFGVEARGSRFAFIVDVSGSMAGPKMATLKRELAASVAALNENASFTVVLFSSTPRIIGGRPQWSRAADRAKDSALMEIRAIEPGGATNPIPAMDIVFGLRPRPDAVYFMTDGQFSELVVQEFDRHNRAWIEPVPVHTISFVSREAEEALIRISDGSGGSYTHIPGTTP